MSNLNNTYQYLQKYDVVVTDQMRKILTTQNRSATHNLEKSIEMKVVENKNGFLIKMDYANYGKYVLDGRRRIRSRPSYNPQNPKDPTTTIGALITWMLNKGISVGGGKIRTPIKKSPYNQGGSSIYQAKAESEQQNPYPQQTAFAFAIWYSTKRRGRTFAGNTNFLKPFENISSNRTFQQGLIQNLARDGKQIFTDQYKSGNSIIKIKM